MMPIVVMLFLKDQVALLSFKAQKTERESFMIAEFYIDIECNCIDIDDRVSA